MSILESYNNLGKRKLTIPTVKSFIPRPEESDYEKGYITRYFTQRIRDGYPIYEINTDSYSTLNSNIYYNVVSIKWRISGPKEPIYDDSGFLIDKGVIGSNRKSILLERDVMPDLRYYLSNLTQFHKK